MKYLVCGICLQGNKGGPAIAVSLMKVIREDVDPDAEFGFMVPGAMLPEEEPWAIRYGVEVYPETTLRVLRKSLKDSIYAFRAIRDWVKTARTYDVIVEMQAIAYVGPPERPLMQNLLGGRFANFLLSKLAKRRMIAWTQSLGPFNSTFVKLAAKVDLKRQPIVFCRGEAALRNVHQLLPGHPAKAYPDVACILPYDKEEGKRIIEYSCRPDNRGKPIATISPSAVLYRKGDVVGGQNKHISAMVHLFSYLSEKGYAVYLIPHTVMPSNPGPKRCDMAVCEEILKDIQVMDHGNFACLIDAKDLGPEELKGVISNAEIHVGGRYHSVIAGLSSGVPTIALAWHEKYSDIMEFYQGKSLVYDESNKGMPLEELVDEVLARKEEVRTILLEKQIRVETLIRENAREFKEALGYVNN